MSETTIITPSFSGGLNVNDPNPPTYTQSSAIHNNTFIKLNLKDLLFNLSFTVNGLNLTTTAISLYSIYIDWADGSTDTYNYRIDTNSENRESSNLNTILSSNLTHYYDINSDTAGNKALTVILTDALGNKYSFYIAIRLVMQTFYDLDFELDVQKAIFNNDVATAIFSVSPRKSSEEDPYKLTTYSSPIISVLN